MTTTSDHLPTDPRAPVLGGGAQTRAAVASWLIKDAGPEDWERFVLEHGRQARTRLADGRLTPGETPRTWGAAEGDRSAYTQQPWAAARLPAPAVHAPSPDQRGPSMTVNVRAVRDLSLAELAKIIALDVRPSAQSDAIVDDVREQMLVLARVGAFTDARRLEEDVMCAARRLVPPPGAARISEFSLIRAAWRHLPILPAGVERERVMELAGQALLRAYAQGISNLLRWTQQPPTVASRESAR